MNQKRLCLIKLLTVFNEWIILQENSLVSLNTFSAIQENNSQNINNIIMPKYSFTFNEKI